MLFSTCMVILDRLQEARVCAEVKDPEEDGQRREEILERRGVGGWKKRVSRSRPGVAAERAGPEEQAVSAGVQNVEE